LTDHLVLGNDEVQNFELKESPEQDAISALQSLGYSASQAQAAVKKVYVAGSSSEQLIKAALKSMI
jgi:Holliday junction DNA helicase RuvA